MNKSDINTNGERILEDIKQKIGDFKIFLVSARTQQGIAEIKSLIVEGISVVFVGSSGVGKSTLINTILGSEKQKTDLIRLDDSKGRHTTTKRELIILPSGGLLIDTPGMRELGLWASQSALSETFQDVDEFAKLCKFNDCDHKKDKGCAVVEALNAGNISRQRYETFINLRSGLDPLKAKKDSNAKQTAKRGRQTLIKRPEFSKDK